MATGCATAKLVSMLRLCHLELAVGRTSPCPEERCGFWDDGCAVAGLRPDFSTNPELAEFLLVLRRRVEQKAPDTPYELLPPGLR
jgi:hypothetical protein